MTTSNPQAELKRISTFPSGVQPGGGWCMGLELAWGRLRRACLRRFWPSYVRTMMERRQGLCQDCPHDIIDPRDLKYCRNVCGYWFRPEDDPFIWRNYLGLARIGLVEVVCCDVVFGLLTVLLILAASSWGWFFWLPLPVVAAFWVLAVAFFRDPERAIPSDPDALLSPADGTITDVGEVDEPDFPGGRAFRIGMFLSIFNVHINRMPRAGEVVNLRYFRGFFLDVRDPEAAIRNEQMWIDLEETGTRRPVRVKQISGKIARRIVCWLKLGETIRAGERLGMIKFGSRTEVYVPIGETVEVAVKVGDKVKGGSTVLMRLKHGAV